MCFQVWEEILRTLVVGVLAYIGLVAFLRISGKRTLAKLNAFGLVVIVALGSTLAAILLQESIALAEGAVALALLIFMQFLVTFVSVRWHGFARLVRSEPILLAWNGRYCEKALKAERLTPAEVLAAIRSQGGHAIDDAETVIPESDGTVSVALTSAGSESGS